MLQSDKDEKRPSMITEKKFSTTGMEIKQGFEAAMGMMVNRDERSDIESQYDKRHSSI